MATDDYNDHRNEMICITCVGTHGMRTQVRS